ncbi:UNVERIFIED_CONTAM: hypothetical protein GTU68_002036 [Idotea baltica]|nr:hypothetical protein [Idotea baltica]
MIVGTMRLGQWGSKFSKAEYQKFISKCVQLGCNTFDHADIYGDYTTEAEFGDAIAGNSTLRNEIKIITKCGIKRVCDAKSSHYVKSYDSSIKHITESVNASLRNFKTDYIDQLLIHRPDYLMDPRDIAHAFTKLREAGKVRSFGVSNFSIHQFDLLNSFFPLTTNQIEASLFSLSAFNNGTLNHCLYNKISPQAWSPLGGGAIFSKTTDAKIVRVSKVAFRLSKKYDATVDQILLAFLLKHPSGIIPVLGTSKISRVKSAINAKEISISKMEWYELYQASSGETIA